MKGDVTVDIQTVNQTIFVARFDRPLSKNLWIKFDIQPTKIGQSFDQDFIKQYLVDNLDFTIGSNANTSDVTCIAQDGVDAQGNNGAVLNAQISNDDIIYTNFLNVDLLNEKWIVDLARISITIL